MFCIINTPYCISKNEKGIKSAAGKTGYRATNVHEVHRDKHQAKRCYIMETQDTRQPFCPGAVGHCSFCWRFFVLSDLRTGKTEWIFWGPMFLLSLK